MKIKPVLMLLICCMAFGACCTKVYCDETFFPVLFIRVADSTSPYHTLHFGRLDKTTHMLLDSFSEQRPTVSQFTPWYFNGVRNNEWSGYDYTIRPDSSLHTDTMSQIGYSLQVEKVHCNSCLLADGRADVVRYRDLTFLYRGAMLHDSVILVTGP